MQDFSPGDAFFQCCVTSESMGESKDDGSILFRESHANHRYFDNLIEGIQREVMQPAIHAWSIHAMTQSAPGGGALEWLVVIFRS